MADISYTVEANLKLVGDDSFKSGMKSASSAAEELQKSLGQTLSGAKALGGGLLEMAERSAALVGRLGSAGLAAGKAFGGLMASGVLPNLKALEDRSLQLSAAISAAMGMSFTRAQGVSAELFASFKKDAAASAGETKDFLGVASAIAGPVLAAGASMKQLRDLTGMTIRAGSAMGVSFDQAAGDVTKMVQGTASLEQPLYRALSALPSMSLEKADDFNKRSPGERLKKILSALGSDTFQSAAGATAATFSGLTATLSEQLNTMGGMFGGPLFESVKGLLSRVTTGLQKALEPGSGLGNSLTALGALLSYRFEEIAAAIGRIFPKLGGEAEGLLDRLIDALDLGLGKVVQLTEKVADHWPEIVEGATRFGAALERAVDLAGSLLSTIGGGDMLKGLERVAGAYVGIKAAGALAPMAGGAVDIGSGLFGAGKTLSGLLGSKAVEAAPMAIAPGSNPVAAAFFGGSPAAIASFGEPVILPAAGAAAAGAEAGAAGAAAAGGAGAAIATGGAVAAALLVVGASLLAIRDDVTGVFGWLGEKWKAVTDALVPLQATLEGLWVSLGDLWDALGRLFHAAEPLIALLATFPMLPFVAALQALFGVMETGIVLVDGLAVMLRVMVDYASEAADAISRVLRVITSTLGISGKLTADDAPERRSPLGPILMTPVINNAHAVPSAEPPRKPPPGGQKVEVVLKWDLGEGNEEAIYVRTRKDIVEMTRRATGQARGGRVPGMF